MASNRITPEKRQEVLNAIRRTFGGPEFSTRKVAKETGVSDYSVRQIAKANGYASLATVHTRDAVKNACEQRKLVDADRRTALASRMLDVASRALDDMDLPCTVYNFGGKDNHYAEQTIPRPSAADRRNLMIIAATAIDKHKILDQYDAAGARASAFDEWLKAMTG